VGGAIANSRRSNLLLLAQNVLRRPAHPTRQQQVLGTSANLTQPGTLDFTEKLLSFLGIGRFVAYT